MAFTRRFLTALGIEADKVDEIINAHIEVVDALKEDRDNYKKDAEKLPKVQKELDEANKKIAKNGDENPFEKKYNDLKKEFDDFKDNIETDKLNNNKKLAYSKLLKDNKVSESCIESILEITKLDDIQLDENGKIVDADTHNENIKNKWSSFIETTTITGANTHTPPANKSKNGEITKEAFNKMSYKEKLKIYNEDRKLYDELSK